jgi:hypothetical protein
VIVSTPHVGDVVIRALQDGYAVFDAVTENVIGRQLASLGEAIVLARSKGAADVWHQSIDERGRALGEPFRLDPLPRL